MFYTSFVCLYISYFPTGNYTIILEKYELKKRNIYIFLYSYVNEIFQFQHKIQITYHINPSLLIKYNIDI